MPTVSAYMDQAVAFTLNKRLRDMGLPGPSLEDRVDALIRSEYHHRIGCAVRGPGSPELEAFASAFAAYLTVEDAGWAPVFGLVPRTYSRLDVLVMVTSGWCLRYVTEHRQLNDEGRAFLESQESA